MEKIKFNDLASIKRAGFIGFVSFCNLVNSDKLSETKGVYMILYLKESKPTFLETGTGGFFKDRNPNVPIGILNDNWIDQAKAIYIGKASNLKKRLTQYWKFGQGQKIGHYGGRYIWQIENAITDLIVCWKVTEGEDEDHIESGLISTFRDQYGERPFANLNK